MSNDTEVYLVIRSQDPLELGCALAYLRNKDKTWGFNCEEIKYSEEYGYFFRVSCWANENAWNYRITGSNGEINDLQQRFPFLQIDGYYSDEYTAGELVGGEKMGSDKEDENPMFCLNIIFPSLSKADGWQGYPYKQLSDFLFSRLPSFSYEGGSSSFPQAIKDPVKLDYNCQADDELREELWQETILYLKRLHAPRDVVLQEENYYSAAIVRDEKLWGEKAKDPASVTKSDIIHFLDHVKMEENRDPKDFLDQLENIIVSDLDFTDQSGNNLLHHAAVAGRLHLIKPEFLNIENLLKKNEDGESVYQLALRHGCLEHLPSSMQMKDFELYYKQSSSLEKLENMGKMSLVRKILKSFPNPLASE